MSCFFCLSISSSQIFVDSKCLNWNGGGGGCGAMGEAVFPSYLSRQRKSQHETGPAHNIQPAHSSKPALENFKYTHTTWLSRQYGEPPHPAKQSHEGMYASLYGRQCAKHFAHINSLLTGTLFGRFYYQCLYRDDRAQKNQGAQGQTASTQQSQVSNLAVWP